MPARATAGESGHCLSVRGLVKSYGGVKALDGLDLEVPGGGVHGLIGPNGSGKTTVFNCVSGFTRISAGEVSFEGRRIVGWAPDRLARAGLVRTFQEPTAFPGLSVRENFEVALRIRGAAGAEDGHSTDSLLDFSGLRAIAGKPAESLSYAEMRRLSIAQAVAAGPRLLLLDEPVAGLALDARQQLAEAIREIAAAGTTVLIIEHDMSFLMGLAERITVLNAGRRIFEGSPAEVARDEQVIRVYLGEAHVAA